MRRRKATRLIKMNRSIKLFETWNKYKSHLPPSYFEERLKPSYTGLLSGRGTDSICSSFVHKTWKAYEMWSSASSQKALIQREPDLRFVLFRENASILREGKVHCQTREGFKSC